MKNKEKLICLFSCIFLISCVEHTLSFRVNPDGSYNIKYVSHGDKVDLLDLDFPIPSDSDWTINSTFNDIEAESYDYSASKTFNRGELIPITFYTGDSIFYESLIKHPIKIKYNNWFFIDKYSFSAKIISRDVSNKYPLIEELILNVDNPPKNWYKQAFMYTLLETINFVNIDWNTRPIIDAELKSWKEKELDTISDSTLIDDYEFYKNMGLDIIMHPSSPDLYNEMDSIFKMLEDELKITLGLIDDSFLFRLALPGIIEQTNADSISNDTLFWSFELNDYMNESLEMYAESQIIHSRRILIILSSIVLSIIVYLLFRYKKVIN